MEFPKVPPPADSDLSDILRQIHEEAASRAKDLNIKKGSGTAIGWNAAKGVGELMNNWVDQGRIAGLTAAQRKNASGQWANYEVRQFRHEQQGHRVVEQRMLLWRDIVGGGAGGSGGTAAGPATGPATGGSGVATGPAAADGGARKKECSMYRVACFTHKVSFDGSGGFGTEDIVLTNYASLLGPDCFISGQNGAEKKNDLTLGKHGDGLKTGLETLLSQGYNVEFRTGGCRIFFEYKARPNSKEKTLHAEYKRIPLDEEKVQALSDLERRHYEDKQMKKLTDKEARQLDLERQIIHKNQGVIGDDFDVDTDFQIIITLSTKKETFNWGRFLFLAPQYNAYRAPSMPRYEVVVPEGYRGRVFVQQVLVFDQADSVQRGVLPWTLQLMCGINVLQKLEHNRDGMEVLANESRLRSWVLYAWEEVLRFDDAPKDPKERHRRVDHLLTICGLDNCYEAYAIRNGISERTQGDEEADPATVIRQKLGQAWRRRHPASIPVKKGQAQAGYKVYQLKLTPVEVSATLYEILEKSGEIADVEQEAVLLREEQLLRAKDIRREVLRSGDYGNRGELFASYKEILKAMVQGKFSGRNAGKAGVVDKKSLDKKATATIKVVDIPTLREALVVRGQAVEAFELQGFQRRGGAMNGVYTMKKGRQWEVNGHPTFWTREDKYFLYIEAGQAHILSPQEDRFKRVKSKKFWNTPFATFRGWSADDPLATVARSTGRGANSTAGTGGAGGGRNRIPVSEVEADATEWWKGGKWLENADGRTHTSVNEVYVSVRPLSVEASASSLSVSVVPNVSCKGPGGAPAGAGAPPTTVEVAGGVPPSRSPGRVDTLCCNIAAYDGFVRKTGTPGRHYENGLLYGEELLRHVFKEMDKLRIVFTDKEKDLHRRLMQRKMRETKNRLKFAALEVEETFLSPTLLAQMGGGDWAEVETESEKEEEEGDEDGGHQEPVEGDGIAGRVPSPMNKARSKDAASVGEGGGEGEVGGGEGATTVAAGDEEQGRRNETSRGDGGGEEGKGSTSSEKAVGAGGAGTSAQEGDVSETKTDHTTETGNGCVEGGKEKSGEPSEQKPEGGEGKEVEEAGKTGADGDGKGTEKPANEEAGSSEDTALQEPATTAAEQKQEEKGKTGEQGKGDVKGVETAVDPKEKGKAQGKGAETAPADPKGKGKAEGQGAETAPVDPKGKGKAESTIVDKGVKGKDQLQQKGAAPAGPDAAKGMLPAKGKGHKDQPRGGKEQVHLAKHQAQGKNNCPPPAGPARGQTCAFINIKGKGLFVPIARPPPAAAPPQTRPHHNFTPDHDYTYHWVNTIVAQCATKNRIPLNEAESHELTAEVTAAVRTTVERTLTLGMGGHRSDEELDTG